MKNIIDRNYKATCSRGKITSDTTITDFKNKLKEEVEEFEAALLGYGYPYEELSDIILVCLNIAKHYKIDIEQQLINKIIKNEKRYD